MTLQGKPVGGGELTAAGEPDSGGERNAADEPTAAGASLTTDAPSANGHMIECRGLTKIYVSGDAETPALLGVSLTIDPGEYVAIMGPSGSGKSTLMHILGALDTPTSGEYVFEGQDLSELSDDELADMRRDRIGFVFQSFNLLPRATVIRNVVLPLVYAGVPRAEREERAEAALRKSGLEESHWSHLSNQLSGGQIQRVAIARALINNPALILADEPTGNLDTRTGEIILDTFDQLNQQGHTIVLITHEAAVAERAKRAIRIQDGLIVSDRLNGHSRPYSEDLRAAAAATSVAASPALASATPAAAAPVDASPGAPTKVAE